MLSIRELMDSDIKGRTIKVKYIDDFEIEIRYLSRSEMRRIGEKATDWFWDQKDHTRKEKMNSEKFYKDFIQKVFAGWTGLKLKTLAKMLPIKMDGDPEMELPYSEENALELMREAYDFDIFIQNIVMDIEKFQEKKTNEK